MGCLRLRTVIAIVLTTGLVSGGLGCAGSDDPEKPENDGNLVPEGPVEAAPAPAAADVPVQTVDALQRRAEEAEKKLAPLRQKVADEPGSGESHHALGRALYEANFKEQAIVHLERAAELTPGVRTLLDLAVGYSGGARLDDAERTYQQLLRIAPNFSIALHNLGALAHRRGDFDRAVDYFNRALQKDPEYLLAHLHLGDAFNSMGRLQDAYRAYEGALELEPQSAQDARGYIDALYKTAALDLQMGAHERAGQFLTELIRLAPNHNRAYYAYGQVLLRMGHPEEAQKAFDRHAQILAAEEPTSPVAMGE